LHLQDGQYQLPSGIAYKSILLLKFCSSNKQGKIERKTDGEIRTEEILK
jgi:hypothetical protein